MKAMGNGKTLTSLGYPPSQFFSGTLHSLETEQKLRKEGWKPGEARLGVEFHPFILFLGQGN